MSPRFEIRIAGELDETSAAAFAHVDITYHGGDTVVTGELDQAGLHGVLERIRALGLDLVEVRRIRGRLHRADPA